MALAIVPKDNSGKIMDLVMVTKDDLGKKERRLIVVLLGVENRYEVYSLSEEQLLSDSANKIGEISPPIITLSEEYPRRASFVGVPDSDVILMVGGRWEKGHESQEFTLLDVSSGKVSKGPCLKHGKANPILFLVDSSLYALSENFCVGSDRPKPTFEVFDISMDSEWRSIPHSPAFSIGKTRPISHTIRSSARVLSRLLISAKGEGTWAFDVTREYKGWEKVSCDELPFVEQAHPHRVGLSQTWYGFSLGHGLCSYVFRFSPQGSLSTKETICQLMPSDSDAPLPKLFDFEGRCIPLSYDGNRLFFFGAGIDRNFYSLAFNDKTPIHLIAQAGIYVLDAPNSKTNGSEEGRKEEPEALVFKSMGTHSYSVGLMPSFRSNICFMFST